MNNFQMKKIALSSIAAAAMIAIVTPSAQAVSPASATYNVIINLTSECTVATTGNITLNYTAGGAAQTGTTTANVTCTNTLPYTLSMNGAPTAGVYSLTDVPTGLNYTVAFNALGTGGVDVAGTGSGIAQGITIGANITAGQMGTCVGATCSNGAGAVQTVFVSY
jgi:spore coat protein U-like protein